MAGDKHVKSFLNISFFSAVVEHFILPLSKNYAQVFCSCPELSEVVRFGLDVGLSAPVRCSPRVGLCVVILDI